MTKPYSNSALDVIKNRRSIRDFDDRIVPENVIREILEAAILAPTSCNMQLNHFIIVNEPELLERFKKPVTGKINWCKQMAVLLVDPKITHENEANYISAGMVVQNFLLRATDLGIATCPIAGFKGKDILRRELDIPERFDIPLLIFFGYPKDEKDNVNLPYRLPVDDVYSYNKFDGRLPFPITSCARKWDQEAIFDYRRRIMSVYFPRFGHSIWGKQYTDAIWPHVEQYIGSGKRMLYVYPWEKEFLERLCSDAKRNFLDIADANKDLTKFTKNTYPNCINDTLDLAEDDAKKLYDTIFLVGSLEFNNDIDKIFKYLSNRLAENGTIIITTILPNGILGASLKILERLGRQRDVYHNSIFYKLGPRFIRSKREIVEAASRNNMSLDYFYKCNTGFLESKVKAGILGATVSVGSRIFPETGFFQFSKR